MKPIERAALNEDLTVLVLGGGFSGLVTSVHLVENGITNFKLIEKGGDFGGTWVGGSHALDRTTSDFGNVTTTVLESLVGLLLASIFIWL